MTKLIAASFLVGGCVVVWATADLLGLDDSRSEQPMPLLRKAWATAPEPFRLRVVGPKPPRDRKPTSNASAKQAVRP